MSYMYKTAARLSVGWHRCVLSSNLRALPAPEIRNVYSSTIRAAHLFLSRYAYPRQTVGFTGIEKLIVALLSASTFVAPLQSACCVTAGLYKFKAEKASENSRTAVTRHSFTGSTSRVAHVHVDPPSKCLMPRRGFSPACFCPVVTEKTCRR